VGIQTRYAEDVHFGRHKSVWGSYFDIDSKRWGYACCMGLDRVSERCSGEAGRQETLKRKAEAKEQDEKRKLEEAEHLKK
jgi:hypothetical protein